MASDLSAVARRAGVSVSTASRALRDLPSISAATKARVRAAAQELDYAASPSAASLATGQTRSIGVVLPYIGRWFFSQVLAGAEEVLRAAGYDVLLFALPSQGAREVFFDTMPLRRRVDGVLLITLPVTAGQMARFQGLRMPISAVGLRAEGISSVGVDDFAEARVATSHLINLGHQRVAMIGGGDSEPNPFTTPNDRRDGYRAAMAAAGLPVPAGYEVDGQYTIAGGRAAMAQLLATSPMPTAVFCQSDRMAMGAMRAVGSVGLDCPRDVSVVGVGDGDIAEPLELTTVAHQAGRQGEVAAHLLLDALAGRPPVQRTLATRLVVRASSGPPRGPHVSVLLGPDRSSTPAEVEPT